MVQKNDNSRPVSVSRLAATLCVAAVISGLLAGCAGQPKPRPAPAASTPPASARLDKKEVDKVAEQQKRLRQRQQQIAELLHLAEQSLAADRLMRPAEDNAFMWYQQVIELDELNSEAHWGMHRITRRYLELAEQAFQTAQPSRAEYLLDSALKVAATPAQAEAIRGKYQDQLKDKVFSLPAADLRARNGTVQQQLADIAQLAREQSSRLLIVARNDAEGRWIYQQMRDAVNGFRLRGNIEVGAPPRIVLIDL